MPLNEEQSSEVDIKRFMNQDVIVGSVENSPSLNRYAYVEGNPVNYLDPFGLEKWEGEHDFLHQLLGELSYGFSKVGIASWFVPFLTPIGYIGGLISVWDSAIHYEELQNYSTDSKYYYSHCISIGVNFISAIPYLGPVFYFLYYWINMGEKAIYDQEISEILADGCIYNKRLEEAGCEGLPLYYYLIYPVSEFYSPTQYGGRH